MCGQGIGCVGKPAISRPAGSWLFIFPACNITPRVKGGGKRAQQGHRDQWPGSTRKYRPLRCVIHGSTRAVLAAITLSCATVMAWYVTRRALLLAHVRARARSSSALASNDTTATVGSSSITLRLATASPCIPLRLVCIRTHSQSTHRCIHTQARRAAVQALLRLAARPRKGEPRAWHRPA